MNWSTKARTALVFSVVMLTAAACVDSAPTGPAAAPTVDTPTATPSPVSRIPPGPATSPVAQDPDPALVGKGCPPNRKKVPTGARTAPTADLDLDGEPDTLWFARIDQSRVLGVTTATKATFSTTFTGSTAQAASALGQQLDYAGPAIVLLNLGRSVQLWDVVDCGLVPTRNLHGRRYEFDLGFTGYGTGVECVHQGDSYELAGLLATEENGGYRVTRTAVILDDHGKQARNGVRTTLAARATADSAVARRARTVTCGTGAQVAESP